MTGESDEAEFMERRSYERFATEIEVDYRSGDNFLFSYIQNISEMGIFIHSTAPMPVGTELELRFEHDGLPLQLSGVVTWINPVRSNGDNINPGMGVAFRSLSPEDRERVVSLVRTIAYLQTDLSRN